MWDNGCSHNSLTHNALTNYMKTLKYLIIALIIFVAGFLLGQSLPSTSPIFNQAENTAIEQPSSILTSFQFQTDQISFYPYDWRQDLSVLEATKEVALANGLSFDSKDYGEMGVLITKIGAKENGQDNNYWQFWVNKEQPQVAADKYLLQPKDILEWKFTQSEF